MDIKQSVNKFFSHAPVKEWICRLLLTNNLWLMVSGLIVFIQTDYQLVSPIIPKSTIYEITRPYAYASLLASFFLAVSLWFYFYKKQTIVIVLQVLVIVAYKVYFEMLLSTT